MSGLKITEIGAELTIQTTGTKLDIYCQDISTNEFNSATGWKTLALDLAVKDSVMQWNDNTTQKDNGRYYIICRSDIDADGNGIPDAREMFVMGTKKVNSGNSSGTLADLAVLSGIDDGVSIPTENGSTNVIVNTDKKLILHKVLYVSKNTGRDTLSGLKPVVLGKDGPKNTIKAALKEANEKDIVQIHSGHYGEDLDISGKDITVNIIGDVDLSGGNSGAVTEPPVLINDPTNKPAISN